MLDRVPNYVWFALGIAFLTGFFFVAGWSLHQSPHQITVSTAHQASIKESVQDISAEIVAYYTKVLAWFTGVLALVAIFQGAMLISADRNTRRSLKVSSDEFVASHRPIIRIRRIFPIQEFAAEQPPRLRILAANVGETNATIFELGWEIYTDANIRPAAVPTPLPGRMEVAPGKQAQIEIEGPVVLDYPTAVAAAEGWIWIVGIINYTDDRGIVRSTSFARRYSSARQRFVPVSDDHPESDREYEN